MTLPLLKVAVVGHTNAGKTSLLRTLTRDVNFGEVSDSPGTTLDVGSCTLMADGQPLVELFDTPGLEDSIALLEELQSQQQSLRQDGFALIETFLQSEASRGRFAQEAKALQQILETDVALYVVDARDRVLQKYCDELRILGLCARPIVPVLNFVANKMALTEDWRQQMARVNMHAVAEFDTVVLENDGEIRLYEKMQTLLERFRPTLDALIASRRQERQQLIRTSACTIAEALVDVAAFSIVVYLEKKDEVEQAVTEMKDLVRVRESQCTTDLLELHRFRPDDIATNDLPVEGSEWGVDLFNPEALQEYGIGGGGGAAAGAAVGLTLDLMFGGLSLGAATALGAAVGAVAGGGRLPGKRLLEKLTGKTQLRTDDATLQLLAARQMDLVKALLQRGHASRDSMKLESDESAESSSKILQRIAGELRSANNKRSWSKLAMTRDHTPFIPSQKRDRLIDDLTVTIEHALQST